MLELDFALSDDAVGSATFLTRLQAAGWLRASDLNRRPFAFVVNVGYEKPIGYVDGYGGLCDIGSIAEKIIAATNCATSSLIFCASRKLAAALYMRVEPFFRFRRDSLCVAKFLPAPPKVEVDHQFVISDEVQNLKLLDELA